MRLPPRAPGQDNLEYAIWTVGAAIAVVLALYALGPHIASMFPAAAAGVQ